MRGQRGGRGDYRRGNYNRNDNYRGRGGYDKYQNRPYNNNYNNRGYNRDDADSVKKYPSDENTPGFPAKSDGPPAIFFINSNKGDSKD